MLSDQLKVCLADTFALYLKAHFFHLNIEGTDFAQYHDFFGDIYEELHGAVDLLAELVRTTGAYAPGSLGRMKELTTISDEVRVLSGIEMIQELLADNAKITATLTQAYTAAEEVKNFAVSNVLQDRLTAHSKHAWMLRSFLKGPQHQ